MNKLFPLLIISLLLLSGCVTQTVKDKLSRNAAQLDGYVSKMDAGNTTNEEDQDLIRVMRIWTWSMNYSVNDEKPPTDVRLILDARTSE